jgi:hypothetical protein
VTNDTRQTEQGRCILVFTMTITIHTTSTADDRTRPCPLTINKTKLLRLSNRCSSVNSYQTSGLKTGQSGFDSQRRQRLLSSPSHLHRFWGSLAILNAYRLHLPLRTKRPEVQLTTPLSSVEVKNARSYTTFPHT